MSCPPKVDWAPTPMPTVVALSGLVEIWRDFQMHYIPNCSLRLNADVCLLPRPWYIGGRGIVFDWFLCFFVCLFVSFVASLLARLRENGWTDLHEIFREGVEWPWDDLITFLVNSEKPRDAGDTGTGFVVGPTLAPQLVFFCVEFVIVPCNTRTRVLCESKIDSAIRMGP